MTSVNIFGWMKFPACVEMDEAKILPEGRGRLKIRVMKNKTTGIVEKCLEMRRIILGAVVPKYVTVVHRKQLQCKI